VFKLSDWVLAFVWFRAGAVIYLQKGSDPNGTNLSLFSMTNTP
jgi:hypothetical protein